MFKKGDKVRMIGYATPCEVVAVEDFHGFETVVLRTLDGKHATRTNPRNVEALENA